MKTLQELAREAGFGSMTMNNGVTVLWDITGPGTVEVCLDRFAALVAGQCARIAERSETRDQAAARMRDTFSGLKG